ncbi:MAG: glycosyltransferase family 39 protein [Catalinimonas sp.]
MSTAASPDLHRKFDRTLDLFVQALFFGALLTHVGLSFSAGLDNKVLEYHNSRQSQTVMTAYWVVEEGFRMPYITPFMGAPWAVPMEFPLYQWLAAALRMLTGWPLELCGRVIGLLMFYAALAAFYKLSGEVTDHRRDRLLVLTLVLAHPVYLYWSRTFMIESTVLALSAWYVWFSVRALARHRPGAYVPAALLGILAGTVKVTTFVVFTLLLFAFFIRHWWHAEGARYSWRRVVRYAVFGLITVGVPLLAVKGWTAYADHHKSLNVMGRAWTSANLVVWNFGDMDDRQSASIWSTIFGFAYTFPLSVLLLVVGQRYAAYRNAILVCFLLFLSGPLVFVVLYFIHDYYSYATALFLCAAGGLSLVAMLRAARRSRQLVIPILLLAGLLFNGYYVYFDHHYPVQKQSNDGGEFLVHMIEAVQTHTAPDEVVLFYSVDGNPMMSNLTQRKTIMNFPKVPLTDSTARQILHNTGLEIITTVVVVDAGDGTAPELVTEALRTLGIPPEPVHHEGPFRVYSRPAGR